jgi:cell division protein ZapB
MDDQIQSLEDKINQFVSLCQRLRQDNHELRQQLASSQNENKQLGEKISDAKTRLEALLTQIPDAQP